jgi:transcriptional regulator MraZ
MALTGTFERSLDDKNRIAVPKTLRDEFSADGVTQLFVAPQQDKSLSVYAPAEFEAIAERIAAKSTNQVEVLRYKRFFYSTAEKVELDGQGRIRIPDRLAEFAQLKRDVVLLGVQDHAEIWDKRVWTEFQEQHAARFDEMAQAALA